MMRLGFHFLFAGFAPFAVAAEEPPARAPITIDGMVDLTTDVFGIHLDLRDWPRPFVAAVGDEAIIFEAPPGHEPGKARGKYWLDVASGAFIHLGDWGAAVPSPTGEHVAYYNEAGDLMLARVANGRLADGRLLHRGADPAKVYDSAGGMQRDDGLAWSADGRRLIYAAVTGMETRIDGPDQSDDFATGSELYLYDLYTEEERKIYTGDRLQNDVAWVKGANAVVFVEGYYEHRRNVAFDPDDYRFDLYRLDLGSGEKTLIAEEIGVVPGSNNPAPSPNGETVVFFHDPYLIKPSSLGMEPARVSIDGGPVEAITERDLLPQERRPVTWAPDGSAVYYVCKRGGLFSSLCRTDPATRRTQLVDLGATEEILWIDVDPAADRLLRLSRDAYDTVRIKISDLKGGNERVVYESETIDIKATALGQVRAVNWTAPDGLELQGLLVLPVDYTPGERYPMIVEVHGGPWPGVGLRGNLGVATPLEWQFWAGKGYAVFVANYRFSGAYGLREENVIRPEGGNLLDVNTADILSGVDHLVESGVADSRRLAVIGHSWGGHITNWLLTRTDRFKAGVSKEGNADMRDEAAGYCKQKPPTCLVPMRATPETHPGIAAEHSAILRADQVRTPTLVFGGRYGAGDPGRTDLPAFVEAINAAGGTAEYVYFEDDYHVFRRPKNIRMTFEMTARWIERYLSSPQE